MDQTPHDLVHGFTASEYESTYPIQSTSDMVMGPECLKGDRTSLPLWTSLDRMTPSDDGVGPDSMGFPKSGDEKTSPIPPEQQAFYDTDMGEDMEPAFVSLADGGTTHTQLRSPHGRKTPSDTVMDPDNGSPSTQHLDHILFPVSGKGYIISFINGGRTPSPLTSPGSMTQSDTDMGEDMEPAFVSLANGGTTHSQLRSPHGRKTPSDDGVGPDFMGFPKSGDGKTRPTPPEIQAFFANELTQSSTGIEDISFDDIILNMKLEQISQTPQFAEKSNGSIQLTTGKLKPEDKVLLNDFESNDELFKKLQVAIPESPQAAETYTAMEPDNGSSLTQDPKTILYNVSEQEEDKKSGLDGGKTSPQLRTSPVTPSDTAMEPDNGSSLTQDPETILYNVSEQEEDKISGLDEGKTSPQLRTLPVRMTPSGRPTGKRPNEETNLLRVEAQPTTEAGNVQANILRINSYGKIYEIMWKEITETDSSNEKTYVPIWMPIKETDSRPEFSNGGSIRKRIDSGDVAPSQSSNVIGLSRPSTSGTPVRDSKRKAEGNEIAENKRWKVTPLYARELTEDEELNKRIVKARTTQRHREKNTTWIKTIEKENTDLKSENTVLKSQVAQLKKYLSDFQNFFMTRQQRDIQGEA